VAAEMKFRKGFVPNEETLRRLALDRGYEIAGGSLAISVSDQRPEWRFVAVALHKSGGASISDLAKELAQFDGVENFRLSHALN
jgi:putative Mg2+ transporter-C (MgtC) family protein